MPFGPEPVSAGGAGLRGCPAPFQRQRIRRRRPAAGRGRGGAHQQWVQALIDAGHHVTADDIHDDVRRTYPVIDLATVYRTLQLLKRLRLVTEIDRADGSAEYEFAGDGRHHHMVCRECHKTFDFSVEYGRVLWLNSTYIVHDSNQLAAKYGAQATEKSVRYANEAARYAQVAGLDPEVARKLDIPLHFASLI